MRCDDQLVDVVEDNQVVEAYGYGRGLLESLGIAARAFVFSVYRWALFRALQSVKVPSLRLNPLEQVLFGGYWVIVSGLFYALVSDWQWAELFSLGTVIVVVLLLLVFKRSAMRRVFRTRSNRCRDCGYNLCGLPSNGSIEWCGKEFALGPETCPECGRSMPRIE